jgi:hypothetical protein
MYDALCHMFFAMHADHAVFMDGLENRLKVALTFYS